MEQWKCNSCGEVYYVHVYYLPPNEERAELFGGFYLANKNNTSPLKAYFFLKKILSACQHFQLNRLEAQYVAGVGNWDLGVFYVEEMEMILAEAKQKGLEVHFSKRDAA